jgi:hypothetical protein
MIVIDLSAVPERKVRENSTAVLANALTAMSFAAFPARGIAVGRRR